jgi:hypothetical protein
MQVDDTRIVLMPSLGLSYLFTGGAFKGRFRKLENKWRGGEKQESDARSVSDSRVFTE